MTRDNPSAITLPRDPDTPPELTTTRLGGGPRARLAAAGAVLVLGAFVYVGISGQKGSTTASPAPSIVAVGPTPVVPELVLPHVDAIEAIRANPSAPVLYQYLGARLSLGEHSTLAILDPVSASEYRVSYRIPLSLLAPEADLNISTVLDTVSHGEFDLLGDWTFSLAAVGHSGSTPEVVLDAQQPPDPRPLADPTFSGLADNGFRVTATAQDQPGATLLTVDVHVGQDTVYPNETYDVLARTNRTVFPAVYQLSEKDGVIEGTIYIPQQIRAARIAIELSAIPANDAFPGPVVFATYEMHVPRSSGADGGLPIFEDTVGPQPRADGLVGILANGYHWQSQFTAVGSLWVLAFTLAVNPNNYTGLGPDASIHNWITGDDGLIGWPSAAKLAPPPTSTR